jgi:hypothetical protein
MNVPLFFALLLPSAFGQHFLPPKGSQSVSVRQAALASRR